MSVLMPFCTGTDTNIGKSPISVADIFVDPTIGIPLVFFTKQGKK